MKKKPKGKIVYINARFLTQEITGVQRFAIEISRRIAKTEGVVIEFLAPKNIIQKKFASELDVKIVGSLTGHLWEQISLPMYLARKRNYILVSFCNTAPLLLKHQIITIHDLSFKINPEWFSPRFSFFYNLLIPKIAKRAKHIITVSKTSKSEITERLFIDSKKISKVYNGVSNVFLNEPVIKKNKDRYLLTVSSHHPRKNFNRLIEAYKLLKDKNIKLYIIGKIDRNFIGATNFDRRNENIKFLDDVSDSSLSMYYQNAELFIFASVYEGFGIPIVEAAVNGIGLCVSNITVFREICEDKAIYFDPFDPSDIANKIDIALSTNLKTDKSFFLEKYDWKMSAIEVLKIIKQNV